MTETKIKPLNQPGNYYFCSLCGKWHTDARKDYGVNLTSEENADFRSKKLSCKSSFSISNDVSCTIKTKRKYEICSDKYVVIQLTTNNMKRKTKQQ